MKTAPLKIFLSTLFFGIVFLLQAQNLVLTDMKSGKTRTIKSGQTIHLKTADMEHFEKAKIQSFNGQSLVVIFPNEDEGTVMELPLSSITEISKITCLHKTSQAVGAACLVVGAYLMFGSAGLAGEDGSAGPYVAGGAVLFVAGVAPYLIKPKTYVLGTTHTAVIQ